ncbi:arabinogalactan endo-1,4-beta-galactosidase [Anaerocolumna jejuensis DSM 15929]|uniref:Arabinogalactan endo-beta-1,4-galactanase n=1 Tax=Anaerocolumna jejuensis DSM 15929 TaxID=1121322 RepID=A0A1M6MH10_9FIRM|nr:glycosyl hydrolase 53 family protein [Anaerocolumna jejuensis]SHJ82735.1 arabinogalactan endo-1,4-beta-galactosidase [Anaerocolumna jejuensis DSM 15929]
MNRVLKKLGKTVISLILVWTLVLVGNSGITEKAYAATSISGVPQISNMTGDFFRGVDISSVLALENSGVKYKYLDGTGGDIFKILAGAGVNYVRIRIWNNPYDSVSPYKGYGGGNTDLYTAKVLGKRATDAGMKVFIDFHYSDFWTDPAKHYAPKAWANYNLKYKKDAVYNYTYDSLRELIDYGVNVQMVQIGNETNGSLCGVGGFADNVWDLSSGVADLMKQGCYAVNDINKKYGRNVLKVLHFTRLIADGEWYAEQVNKMGVDYDVFAASFYPMWDGTVENMTTVLTNIAKKYNKKVMVAETAYPYTFDDADGSMNSIYGTAAMNYSNYPVSISGQAQALYGVFNGIAQINSTLPGYGLGAFYWEPAWIGTDKSAWGTYGTGWASSTSEKYERLFSSTASEYSTTDQGSSWDNMTLFDKNGRATNALYVFNDIRGVKSVTTAGSSGN